MVAFERKIQRWSLSAMKQYTTCPAQYAYKKFDRLDPPPSQALEKGKKVHSLAEAYLKSEIQGLPKELIKFAPEMKAIKDAGFIAEQKWAINDKWQPSQWGDWDNNWCLAMTDAHRYDVKSKHLDIIDFKTGRVYADHVDGAEVYSAMGLSHYPQAKTFNTEFWYVSQDAGELGDSPFKYTVSQVKKFRKKWEAKARRMIAATDFEATPSRKGCRWCSFRSDKRLMDDSMGPCDEWRTVA